MFSLRFLLFIIIALVSHSVNNNFFTFAQTDTSFCNGCITVRKLVNTALGYDAECSTLPEYKGTKPKMLIIRSQTMYKFMIDAGLVNTPEFSRFEGSDAAEEGTWIAPSTEEVLWTGGQGGSQYKFAWLNFSATEPNNVNNEYMVTIRYVSSAYYIIDVRPEQVMTKTNTGVLCMYEHPVISSLSILAAAADTNYLLYTGTEFTRFQIFPAHLPQLEAFTKCQSLFVTDPSTGESVQGFLAVFYTDHEWDIVKRQ